MPQFSPKVRRREHANQQFPGPDAAVSGRRYYSPSQGRFLGRDPIEEKGGLHLYGFVLNNPVNLWDYLGMDPPIDPATGGWILAGGTATSGPLGAIGHYMVGTVSPTGQIQILDYGANRSSGGASSNPAAIVNGGQANASIVAFDSTAAFNSWASKNGYTFYATSVSGSQLDAAGLAMTTIVANPGTYSGLQLVGDSCVSASSLVLTAAGVQTPAATSFGAFADNMRAGGEPYSFAVLNGASALYYTAATPGFAPVAVGAFNGTVQPGVITMDKFVVNATPIKNGTGSLVNTSGSLSGGGLAGLQTTTMSYAQAFSSNMSLSNVVSITVNTATGEVTIVTNGDPKKSTGDDGVPGAPDAGLFSETIGWAVAR